MKSIILTLVYMLLIILFSYTAFAKLIDIKRFAIEMHNQPMPFWFTSILVYLLPAVEIMIVLGLLIDRVRIFALFASLGLMLLFTAYTVLILSHVFPRIPCSCGGVIRNLTWKQHLVFNLIFDVFIFWAILLCQNKNQHKHIHA